MTFSSTRPDTLGVITHGSLTGGVEMKLDADHPIEEIVAGTFAVVQGAQFDFFCLITDVTIDAANEGILLYPPPPDAPLLRRVMQGMSTYATIALKPMLMLPSDRVRAELNDEPPRPVKTVPAHFSPVAKATDEDVARIFGSEHNDAARYFTIGEPLGMDGVPVALDLKRFVERSSAVFGKTGTGKTFITRILLAGAIKTGQAVNLVFDMHSEYGWKGTKENDNGVNESVKGLRQLFGSKVVMVSLDAESTRRRGAPVDLEAFLYADQIEPEDILPLQQTLNLTETAAESSRLLFRRYRNAWLTTLLKADGQDALQEIADQCGAHVMSLDALRRKLSNYERHSFFSLEASKGKRDLVREMLDFIKQGKSIVFEFGRYNSLDVYLLVANVITRRLRAEYEEMANTYLRTDNPADKPNQLLITIEEAHKFLAPGVARETPFGKIAREMRKYFVSLLVVDQRPSAIDDEVLSQIGTKFVAQLSDEKDIAAALVGHAGASALRSILASLDSKQQALVLGHAMPMPIVVRTRSYDADFYAAMKTGSAANGHSMASITSLFDNRAKR